MEIILLLAFLSVGPNSLENHYYTPIKPIPITSNRSLRNEHYAHITLE